MADPSGDHSREPQSGSGENYDPSRDPPGRGFWLSIGVVATAFAALFIAAPRFVLRRSAPSGTERFALASGAL